MALNTTATLTQELFDAIDQSLLTVPDDVYVFNEQVAMTYKGPDEVPRGAKTIAFDKFDHLSGGLYTEASRRLTDGTPVTAASISLTESQKTLTFRQYGGPHDASNVAPLGITEMLETMAVHEVAQVVGQQLQRDRAKFTNKVKMDLLLASTNLVTANDAAEGSITASQFASASWLTALNKKMKDLKVPTFSNGRWKLIIGTRDEQNLKKDSDIKAAFREFAAANPLLRGQLGVYENFDIYVETLMPTKGVGAASAVTGYQGVAFGPLSLAQAAKKSPQAAFKDDTDYGRQSHVIWKAIEAWGELYADLVVRTITT
jgi:N4-gp56 family major capsid protein